MRLDTMPETRPDARYEIRRDMGQYIGDSRDIDNREVISCWLGILFDILMKQVF
jgi:hypothetical protein